MQSKGLVIILLPLALASEDAVPVLVRLDLIVPKLFPSPASAIGMVVHHLLVNYPERPCESRPEIETRVH